MSKIYLNQRPIVYMRDRTHTYLWIRDESEFVGLFLTMDTGTITLARVNIEDGVYRVYEDAEHSWDLVPYEYNPQKAFLKYQDSLLDRTPKAEAEMLAILALFPGPLPKPKVRLATVPQTAEPKARSVASKASGGGYSLAQLCTEIGMDPSKARKILRNKKIEKPGGKWEWASAEAASSIRTALGK